MPEYRAPGVYVEEVDRGPKSVEGVSTSTAAFLGQTERGPTDPEFITNFADFERTYGGFGQYKDGGPLAGTYLAYAIDGFFRNGGTRAYVGRITQKDTPTASTELRAAEPGSPTPRVDFGTIPPDGETTKHLILHNTSDEPLSVTPSVPSSTAFELIDAGTTVVEPTKSAVVGITFSIDAGGPDPESETLTVTYAPEADENEKTEMTVELTGHGDADLATSRSEIEFDQQMPGESTVERVTLTNRSGKEIESLSVADLGSPFSLTVDNETLRPEGETTLNVTFAPEAVPVSQQNQTITISYDIENEGTQSLEIPVSGTSRQPLVTETPVVDFGVIPTADAPAEATVTVRNDSDSDLTLGTLTVEKQDPGDADLFTVTGPTDTTVQPGKTATMTVTLTDLEAPLPQTLQIPYTDEAGRDMTQTVDLFGLSSDSLTVSQLVVDAGSSVPKMEGEPHSVEITNTSSSDVTLALPDPPEGFSATPETELVLAQGVPETVEVTFTPQEAGDTSETWELTGGDPDPIPLTLRGTGITPFEVSIDATFARMTAVGPGVWGTHVVGIVEPGSLDQPETPLFKLTLRYWTEQVAVQFVRDNGLDHPDAPEPDVEEIYDNLSLVETSSEYFVKRINASSTLVDVAPAGDGTPSRWDVDPAWLTETFSTNPDPVTVDDYEGEDTPGARTGFAALREIDDISIVCVPDEASGNADLEGLTDSVVTHCETLRDRFAIVQAPEAMTEIENLRPTRGNARLDSSFAGFYYPWLKVRNPATRMPASIPPGGHIAGIYARSDSERGVHKAPANEVIRGINDVELSVTKAEQEVLNPKGVNCIRKFPGRGIRVWGARTASTDPSWKYVNVRRLFLYIEESIDEGTQWVVFEPNSENLWARVRQTITNFLETVWRNGALMGTTAEEAFYVRCDRSTMTQDDIDNGRLIVEIGVAPVKPAEFVIFRISQWTEGAAGG